MTYLRLQRPHSPGMFRVVAEQNMVVRAKVEHLRNRVGKWEPRVIPESPGLINNAGETPDRQASEGPGFLLMFDGDLAFFYETDFFDEPAIPLKQKLPLLGAVKRGCMTVLPYLAHDNLVRARRAASRHCGKFGAIGVELAELHGGAGSLCYPCLKKDMLEAMREPGFQWRIVMDDAEAVAKRR